jgi:hypothetical protein
LGAKEPPVTVGRFRGTILPDLLDYSKQLEYQLKKLDNHSEQRGKTDNLGEAVLLLFFALRKKTAIENRVRNDIIYLSKAPPDRKREKRLAGFARLSR